MSASDIWIEKIPSLLMADGLEVKRGQRLKIDGTGKIAIADAADKWIGLAKVDAKQGVGTNGNYLAVQDKKCPGVFGVQAEDAITAGTEVDLADAGHVKATLGVDPVGVAISDAAADEVVQVIFY